MAARNRYPLLVIANKIGACSQTFIENHTKNLLPGRTAVIGSYVDQRDQCWFPEQPCMVRGSKNAYKVRRFILRRIPWKLEPVRRSLTDSLGWKKRVDRFASKHGVEVVLCEFLDVAYDYVHIFRELGIPLFAHAHGYDVSRVLKQASWSKRYQVFNACKGIITMSNLSKNRLEQVGVRPDQVHVVPYGVKVPDRMPDFDSKNRSEVRCIAVGRMVPKKAPLLLLESFRQATEERSDLRLDYVGDGPIMAKALEFVRKNGLADKINFHGALSSSDVHNLLRQANIFIQHSIVDPASGDEEGLPVSILEAMAHALPVVSTFHSAIPEEVEDGVTGFLVNEGDTREMSRRILMLASQPELRVDFGVSAWRRVGIRFNMTRQNDELRNLLQLV